MNMDKSNVTKNYLLREDLLREVENYIHKTDTVLEIGCGIAPMNYFRPKIHVMVEPWKEYADIVSFRYKEDKSVIMLNCDALSAVSCFMDNSFDSIFLIDVIEHMDKKSGKEVIQKCERLARNQVIVFTPLGFMPQHMDREEKDGWGLSGTTVQEHLSGWTPDDFGTDWEFHVCERFHDIDFKGEPLEKVYGAFFAIYNPKKNKPEKPSMWSDIRKPLPSEIELRHATSKIEILEAELRRNSLIINHPVVRIQLWLWRFVKSLQRSVIRK
jgi:hypothetical protein